MKTVFTFSQIHDKHRHLVGTKALNLGKLQRQTFNIPDGITISADFYHQFIESTGLDHVIAIELNRLDLQDMRWEEYWDLSLRIRNIFLKTDFPPALKNQLTSVISAAFAEKPVAVRSSSPQEDSADASFAGLHQTFINIRGVEEILKHIRLVWASLWSDGAILYRKELGMDLKSSAMAVIIQKFVEGETSGVCFTSSPENDQEMSLEAVYGLNEGLVDGTVAPDHWQISRNSGQVLSHIAPKRDCALRCSNTQTDLKNLSDEEKNSPPLNSHQITEIVEMGGKLEDLFNCPQDFEWTYAGGELFLLQSRTITTLKHSTKQQRLWENADKRPWYLTLKKSFENLKSLHLLIRDQLLPKMHSQADQLNDINLEKMDNNLLASEILRRREIHQHWLDVYWEYFIPFAHGARLLGEVYNDTMQPENPYEFTTLLTDTNMTSLQRNHALISLAQLLKNQPSLLQNLSKNPESSGTPDFEYRLAAFLDSYDEHTFKNERFFYDRAGLITYLLEMTKHPTLFSKKDPPPQQQLTTAFVNKFPLERRQFAQEIIDIGRASYQLRDDDNIVLSRIEAQLLHATNIATKRLKKIGVKVSKNHSPEQIAEALKNPGKLPEIKPKEAQTDEPVEHHATSGLSLKKQLIEDDQVTLRARQLIGQPAGNGLAMGKARVIHKSEDLFQFKSGEILVCDSIDPNMTFIVPLAAAIVERRGGMLVHGAIIAREYGIPCVTGVADLANLIKTGDQLTVDGYQGIVTKHN